MSDRRAFVLSLLLEPEHEQPMRRAIAWTANNPRAPCAAVFVDAARNEIVAEGGNKSRRNPLLHGETDAINRCAEQNPGIDYSPRCMAAAL